MSRHMIAITFGVLSAFLLTACEEEVVERAEVVRPVIAIKIKDAKAISEAWVPGLAKATQEVDLSFEVSGKVVERPVFVGDEVKKGDVVARLDPRDYQNDLDAAAAERDRAKSQFDRVEQAAKSGAVAKQEVTNAQAALKAAEAEVRIKQKALDDTQIVAPYDGVIAWTYVEAFEDVREKQPVVRLVDTSRIEFVANVPESDITLMPYVKNVRVKFDAFPDQEIPAEIKEVATEAAETTRTYAVNLIMDQPEGMKILPGMAGKANGDVVLPEGEQETIIHVPATAIFSPKGENSYVWIIDEQSNTVSQREVKTRLISRAGVPVEEGLQVGDWIAVAGVHFLQEGQKVKISEAQE